MKTNKVKKYVLVLSLFISAWGFSQEQEVIYTKMTKTSEHETKKNMKTYLIERDIPDAGKLTQEQLQGISKKSNAVVAEMGPEIEWLHSYVTDNKVYCVYRAKNKGLLREHAEKGGFPANRISELSTKINPDTGKN